MSEPLRVGFQFFGGKQWAGGLHYLTGLLSALGELPDRPVAPVLFVEPTADAAAVAQVEETISRSVVWLGRPGTGGLRLVRLGAALVLGRDPVAARALMKSGVDVFFHHMVWYGRRLGLPTVAWIPDFQHRRLPTMFDRKAWIRREVGYRQLTRHSSQIVVSSEDARVQCEEYYPAARGRVSVLRFAVRIRQAELERPVEEVRRKYVLPEKYVFFPGQFWKHKNHLGVVAAVRLLRDRGSPCVLVMSGGFDDYRNPGHARHVLAEIARLGLEERIRVLGHIPYADMVQLLRGSVAMVNPSFWEGWSTTVEEAKALGVPLVLSNLAVHREQAGERGSYFDPGSSEECAGALSRAWERGDPGPDLEREVAATAAAKARWLGFAREFVRVMQRAAHR